MLREDGAQRVSEHRVFKEYARERGETDAGADGVRNRDRHRSEAKDNPYRGLDVTVRACEEPELSAANHDAVVLGEIPGRFRKSTTLHIVLRGCNDERHRSRGTSDQPGRRL